jgi:hypothetical protein
MGEAYLDFAPRLVRLNPNIIQLSCESNEQLLYNAYMVMHTLKLWLILQIRAIHTPSST